MYILQHLNKYSEILRIGLVKDQIKFDLMQNFEYFHTVLKMFSYTRCHADVYRPQAALWLVSCVNNQHLRTVLAMHRWPMMSSLTP